MRFLSPEVALYLSKSTMRPCMEFYCHVRAGAPSCHLELLDKLQKRICRTVGPSLAASLEPLSHCRNLASLGKYYFVSVHLNWFSWFHFLILEGSLLVMLIRLVFSRFLDLRGNLGNVKEKPTRKTCFSREKKRLAPRTSTHLAKFCWAAFL